MLNQQISTTLSYITHSPFYRSLYRNTGILFDSINVLNELKYSFKSMKLVVKLIHVVAIYITNLHSSQHPCALALPYKKDPFYRGDIHFLDNNGSNLNVSSNNTTPHRIEEEHTRLCLSGHLGIKINFF